MTIPPANDARQPAGDWSAWEAQFVDFLHQQLPDGDGAHDMAHIQRVVANARRLAAAEGAKLAVVLPAAWLHDCVVVAKDSPDRSQASSMAAETAAEFLKERDYPEDLIPAIAHAIAAHSFSAGILPQTLEAQVVQDADRLDALGAIGIARTFVVGGVLGRPLYDEFEPLPVTRQPDDLQNTVDHFYTKLLTLAATMQTASGRETAEQRSQYMRDYLAQLVQEIHGRD